MNTLRHLLFLTCLLSLASGSDLLAQTYTTIAHGEWSNVNTWDANGVPTEPIPAGAIVNVEHFVSTWATAAITSNGTININGNSGLNLLTATQFINNGTFNAFSTTFGAALGVNDGTSFTNNGLCYVEHPSTGSTSIRLNGGTFTNSSTGTLDLVKCLFSIQDGDALFVNEDGGSVDLGNDSQFSAALFTTSTTSVVFSNAGTFDAFGSVFMSDGSGENLASGIINIHKTFTLRNEGFTNAGTINTLSPTGTNLELLSTLNSSTGTINHDNRFFRGNSTLIISTFTNNAVVIPFDIGWPGGNTLNITGNYDGNGQMRTFIKGTASSDYGRLEITGTADISQGNLWAFLSGFTPVIGDAFTIISAAGGVTGPFASTILPNLPPDREWKINYNPTTVVLEVVPPASCDAPVALCKNATVEVNNAGIATVMVSDVDNGSSVDTDCGPASTMVNPTSFTCANVGDNTVTLTIMDNEGSSSSCTATVTVEDNIDPTISCPMDIVVPNDPETCEGTFTVPTPTADDNCGVTVLRYRWRPVDAMGNNAGPWSSWSTAAMQTLDVGNYKFQWQAKDAANNQNKCAFFVDIVDTEPPVAVCKNTTVEFNGQTEIILQASDVFDDVNSTDNCSDANLLDFNPTSVTCDQLGMTVPVTVSVEDDAGNPDQCTANVTVGGLPCGFSANPNGINCAGNAGTYNPTTDTYMINSEGCYDPNYYSNSDSHGYLGTQICGNGEIIAEITNISGDGFAGVAMREDLSAGSKMLQLSIDGVSLSKRELRSSTNGVAFNHLFQTQGKNWLRLTRAGNDFTAQHSTDGMSWAPVFATNISMPNCIEVGLFTENNTPSGSMTATFENVEVKDGKSGLTAPGKPGLTVGKVPNTTVSVFPNPSNGEVFVNLDAFIGQPAQIEVVNNLGQSMKWLEIDDIEVPTQRLDLSGYQNGLYFIKVQIADQPVITRKLMLVGER